METTIDLTEQYAEVSVTRDAAGNNELVIEAENGDIITLLLSAEIFADLFSAMDASAR